MKIGEYFGYEQLNEGKYAIVYRASSSVDDQKYILKVPRTEPPIAEEAQKLKQEYEIMSSINIEGVVRPVALLPYYSGYALVLEDNSGISLQQLMKRTHLTLEAKLQIAISISAIVGQLHRQRIMHKDLKPRNIIVEPDSLCVWITDFGIAGRFQSEVVKNTAFGQLEGTLSYMSPEQTGRMNRMVDYRTDIYSLGATLYEMLTGVPPFQAESSMEWIYCHLARTPIPPAHLDDRIPQALSDIVMKCLAKNPEERYQSAQGLEMDLSYCRDQLKQDGIITYFTIGERDRKDIFHIPGRLYGREAEAARLKSLYDRLEYGSSQCALVSGPAGSGKSSLVQDLMMDIALGGGLFVSGKFDVLKRHVPYSGLLQGLREVLRNLSSESEEEVAAWKEMFTQRLKESLRVLIQLLPELEWIVGPQEVAHSSAALSAVEAKNRLHYAVLQLLECLTEKRHIVWFVDDLQWADPGSLQLLHFLMVQANSPSIMLIGAYRSEDWEGEQLLRWFTGEVQSKREKTEFISIRPMNDEVLQTLLFDTFGKDLDNPAELKKILMEYTGGNPFDVKQFIYGIVEQKMLWLDEESGKWKWEENKLLTMKVSDHMTDFLLQRIDQLSDSDKEALKYASCIADQFNLDLLADLMSIERNDLQQHLNRAIDIRLIAPSGPDQFIFLHDRIRNFFYDDLCSDDKQVIHIKIAKLIESSQEGDGEEKLFLSAHHYRLGLLQLTGKEEKLHIAHVFQQAAEQAKSSGAYDSAAEWYECGIRLLEQDAWEHSYKLAFGLHLGKWESNSLQGKFEETEEKFESMLELSKTPANRAAVYTVMINQFTQIGQHEETITTGMEGLNSIFGLRLNASPSQGTLFQSLGGLLYHRIRKGDRQKNSQVKEIHEDVRSQMKLLMDTATSAYFVNPTLYLNMMLTIVRYSIIHGNFTESSNAYNALGLLLGSGLGRYQQGYEMGCYGLELSNQFMHPGLRCKSHFTFAVFIAPWKQHMRKSVEDLWTSYHAGMEAGDLVFSGYAVTYILLLQDFLGLPAARWIEEADRHLPFLQQTGNPETLHMIRLVRQAHTRLQESYGPNVLLSDSEFEEKAWIEELMTIQNQVVLQVFYMKKMMLSYLSGDMETALEMSRKSEGSLSASFGLFHTVEHVFYTALTLYAHIDQSSSDQRKQLMKEARQCEHKLYRWAREAPENYRHLYLLIKAERFRIQKNTKQAERDYEHAVEYSRVNGFEQFNAIAAERLADFYLQEGRMTAGRLSMAEAYKLYEQWGVMNKMKQIEEAFPEFKTNPYTTTATLSTDFLDLEAIMNVSQALSQEIVLQNLLEKIMSTLIQVSGATRGVLVIKQPDGLYVAAEGEGGGKVGDGTARHLAALELHAYKEVPASIVLYAARTNEDVVLDDASRQGYFVKDPYILNHETRSVLCIPILHQGTLNAIVYLENHFTSHVFNDERRMVVHLLAGQAAISIEHAKLISVLEYKVKERTEELMQMENDRRKLLANISHDLGTPLTSIQGYVEAILDQVVTEPEQQHKYMKVIHSRVLSIQRLFKDLVQLSRMEAKQLSLTKNPVHAGTFLQWLSQKYELDIEQSGIHYRTSLHPDLLDDARREEMQILVDRERIGQVFTNLINNAINHTQEGTIELSADIAEDGYHLLIQVTDTGIGIPESDIPYVFERFYRGSKSRNSKYGGSGLGLAIAKEIIQLHEGEIGVDSLIGQGSTFYVKLPFINGER
ncbi:AAA family ATPase [Neobacillus mesonae]|nr:AAA family ATPase [Neobacillus mesonae]